MNQGSGGKKMTNPHNLEVTNVLAFGKDELLYDLIAFYITRNGR
jgi:hypothetical protein